VCQLTKYPRTTAARVRHAFPLVLVTTAAVDPGVIDPVIVRPGMDGIAGARNDSACAPSVDIANRAPSGADATDQIVLTWADGAQGHSHEQPLLMASTNDGASFTDSAAVPLTAGTARCLSIPSRLARHDRVRREARHSRRCGALFARRVT
jgi:hypothetical protein